MTRVPTGLMMPPMAGEIVRGCVSGCGRSLPESWEFGVKRGLGGSGKNGGKQTKFDKIGQNEERPKIHWSNLESVANP